MYLLGTNVCIGYISGKSVGVLKKMRQLAPSSIYLCSVVLAELYYGAYKSAAPEKSLQIVRQFVGPFVSLPFDSRAATIYGQSRARLAKQGTPIGPYDQQIAAVALAHGLTLVTHNTKEFSRVVGLKLEDWELL